MTQNNTPPGERLQKVLANAGMGSRREIEGWISAGRVMVNEETARLGQRVLPSDRIKVDGRPVANRRLEVPEREVLVYNKPEGELVTRKDPEGRRTVFERLPKLKHGRWIPVGRLDLNSSGLLLLTTDGELANRLMHPGQQVEREYAVRVMGEISEDQLKQLTHGVELEDGPARFEEIVESGGEGINRWFHVVIMEGRQREVRRMWEAVGARVNRLKRVRYGSVILESALKIGRWRYLEDDEINKLLESMGLPAEKRRKKPQRSEPKRFSKEKPPKAAYSKDQSPWEREKSANAPRRKAEKPTKAPRREAQNHQKAKPRKPADNPWGKKGPGRRER